jgi:hypothetical protein
MFMPTDIMPLGNYPPQKHSNKELAIAWVKNSSGLIPQKDLQDRLNFLLEVDYPGTFNQFMVESKKIAKERGPCLYDHSQGRLYDTLNNTVAWVKRQDPEIVKKEMEEKRRIEEAKKKADEENALVHEQLKIRLMAEAELRKKEMEEKRRKAEEAEAERRLKLNELNAKMKIIEDEMKQKVKDAYLSSGLLLPPLPPSPVIGAKRRPHPYRADLNLSKEDKIMYDMFNTK